MTRIILCRNCKFYKGGNKCEAYPDGIPYDIFWNYEHHIEKKAGVNGIQFKRADLPENDPLQSKKELQKYAKEFFPVMPKDMDDKEILY